MDVRQSTAFDDQITDSIVAFALALLNITYKQNPAEDKRRAFHNHRHTKHVKNRVGRIVYAIRRVDPTLISSRQERLLTIAAACHDLAQYSKVNEAMSGGIAASICEVINRVQSDTWFSEDDRDQIRAAINATVAEYNATLRTVIQLNLSEQSSPIERVLALADLGAAGMDGPRHFLEDGNKLFRELNPEIGQVLATGTWDPNQQHRFTQKMLGWSDGQVYFVIGRQGNLDAELKGLPSPAADAVRALFSQFGPSIAAARVQATQRVSMDFRDLAVSMGYEL
jgi:hypothetical protein